MNKINKKATKIIQILKMNKISNKAKFHINHHINKFKNNKINKKVINIEIKE